ncbi:unnamed protein product [Oikopleura dioica]|uniref:Uncharacterized protein n=1 Tax=Oikopleura dioica TaxID=34765 RepID=E4YIX3_OIKDI|nr:unnamed protein product [Oikopleura dioica]
MTLYGVIEDSYRLFQKLNGLALFFSFGAMASSLFWVLQEFDIVGTKIEVTENHVRPGVFFEIALIVFASFSLIISIVGLIYGCKQSTKMMKLYGGLAILASIFCLAGLAYCIYIGAQSVVFYDTKQFLLHEDLIPWIPATFCFFLAAFIFIIVGVLSFKQEKLQADLLRNYGPTSFTGTINENFSNDKTNDKIYESLDRRGFDLRSIDDFEPREVVDDFEYRTKKVAY